MKKLKVIVPMLIVFVLVLAACSPQPANTSAPQAADTEVAAPVDEADDAAVDDAAADDTADMQEPVTLTIIHDWEPSAGGTHGVLADVIEQFSADHPNIEIVQEINDTMSVPNKVETSFLAGEEPDIVFINQFNNTVVWPEKGVTVPVQDYLEEWGMAEDYFLPSAIDSYTSDEGDLRAFPLEGFTWPVFYRADIFEEAGVEIPTTQEELIAVAPALRAAGYEPLTVGGSDWTGLNLIMLQMQGCMEDKEGIELAANGGWAENENAQKCAELFVEMRDNGVFADGVEGLDFTTMFAKFANGKAAMIMTGSWSFVDIPEEMRDTIVAGGFPVPEDSVQEKPVYYSSFNAKGVWITRNGLEKIDAVGEFIRYLYQPENIARFVEAGMVSPLITVPVDESKVNPLSIKAFTLAETGHVLLQPQDAFPPTVFGEIERVLRGAYIPEGMSAQEILEELDSVY